MVPFTWVPEDVAVGLIIIFGLIGTLWAIRRLRLPLWWIAFPPFIDGLYNANPHVLILPLLVAGAAPIAVLVKIYAGVVPLIRGDLRAVLLSAAILVVTIPILPWAWFIDQMPTIMDALRAQASGGMSAWAIPILVPVGVVALLVMGRDRAAWWAVPCSVAEHPAARHLARDAGGDALGGIRRRDPEPMGGDHRERTRRGRDVDTSARGA